MRWEPGPLTDRFGRKSLLMVDAGIFALGSILSAVTVNAEMLLLSRTLIGLAVGADSAIATAYIAEFAPSKKRGQLSIIQQWMITVGILASFLIALLIFKVAPEQADGAGWRIILGLGAVPAVIAVVLRARMPESPRWLMSKGRYDDTKKALGMLGIEVTEDEVRRTADRIAELEGKKEPPSTGSSAWTKGVKRALAVVCGFFVFQQITGINIPFYYGPRLLADFFDGPSNSGSRVGHGRTPGSRHPGRGQRGGDVLRLPLHRPARAAESSRWVGSPAWRSSCSSRPSRRRGSPDRMTVMVMVGFSFFITSFAIGVGGTGWLIQGEVFPTAVRGRAAAIAASVNWLANFVLIVHLPHPEQRVRAGLGDGAVRRSRTRWRWPSCGGSSPRPRTCRVEEVVAVFERQATGTRANALDP